jgi:hypothetical protein
MGAPKVLKDHSDDKGAGIGMGGEGLGFGGGGGRGVWIGNCNNSHAG